MNIKMQSLKPCPFCGTIPVIYQKPLWNGSHGYHGEYEFEVKCDECGCTNYKAHSTTITNPKTIMRDAQALAIVGWNERYNEV